MSKFETVIGLEVHVQLQTLSKMFCRCPNSFGETPNTLVCPVCMGLPGVLPVLNKKALMLGLRVALALNCEIKDKIVFERKNYFYPDLPKNYQISQYAKPLGEEGYLQLGDRKIRIKRVHLEEDAGKLIHRKDCSLVDLNRAGVPLLEIVSHPDIGSPQEAYQYLVELKLILRYINASSCDMEKGFLRCDSNISLRAKGDRELGVKVELKNMNSFRQVQDALEYEIKRQEKSLHGGESISQQTRLWDEEKRKTLLMRTKEEAHDYRYFPEPDLVTYTFTQEDIKEQEKSIGELPARKRERFKSAYSIGDKEIDIITSEVFLGKFFEESVKEYKKERKVCNWVIGPLLEVLHHKKMSPEEIRLRPENFVKLVRMMDEGKITNIIAKEILAEIIGNDKDPELMVKKRGLASLSKEEDLMGLVEEAARENPKACKDYAEGKEQALMFLVGQVMRKTKGKASPNVLKELFRKSLKE